MSSNPNRSEPIQHLPTRAINPPDLPDGDVFDCKIDDGIIDFYDDFIPDNDLFAEIPELETATIPTAISSETLLSAIEVLEEPDNTIEVLMANKYIVRIEFRAEEPKVIESAVAKLDGLPIFRSLTPTFQINSDETFSFTLYIEAEDPQKIEIELQRETRNLSRLMTSISSLSDPYVKCLKFKNGYIIPIFGQDKFIPIPKVNRHYIKPTEKVASHLTSANQEVEIQRQKPFVTLQVDLGAMTLNEINHFWNDSELKSLSTNPNAIITFNNNTGLLTIGFLTERSISELLQIVKYLSEKIPGTPILINNQRLDNYGNSYTTETKEQLNQVLQSAYYLGVIHTKCLSITGTRYMHMVDLKTEPIPGTDYHGIISITPKVQLKAREIVGLPHQQCLQELLTRLDPSNKNSNVVHLQGPAGIGKTNLVANLHSRKRETEPEPIFITTCLSPLNSPLQSSSLRDIAIQMAQQIIELGLDLEVTAELLDYLRLDPATARSNPNQIFRLIKQTFLQLGKALPTAAILFTIEDQHFIDFDSEQKIKQLITELSTEVPNLKILVTHRKKNEFANMGLYRETNPINVPAIPFQEEYLTPADYNPLNGLSNVVKNIPHKLNVSTFTKNFYQAEYPEIFGHLNFSVDIPKFYALLMLSGGNPNSAELLLRTAYLEKGLVIDNKNTLTLSAEFLDQITEKQQTGDILFNSILQSQIQNLKPVPKRVFACLTIADEIPTQEFIQLCTLSLNLDEAEILSAIKILQQKGLIIEVQAGKKQITKTNTTENTIYPQNILDDEQLTTFAESCLLSSNSFSLNQKLKILKTILSKHQHISTVPEYILRILNQTITELFATSLSTKQAEIIYHLIQDLECFKSRISELKVQFADPNKSSENINYQETDADNIVCLVVIAGLFAATETKNIKRVTEIMGDQLEVFELAKKRKIYNIYSEFAQTVFDSIMVNLYLSRDASQLQTFYDRYSDTFKNNKTIHMIYLAARYARRKTVKHNGKETSIAQLVTPQFNTLEVKISGYDLALLLIDQLLNSSEFQKETTNKEEIKNRNEIKRLKLRIQYEKDRAEFESKLDDTHHSQEYYPLASVSADHKQRSKERLEQLQVLNTEASKSPLSFYDHTRLTTLEQIIQEKLLQLKRSDASDFTLGRLDLSNMQLYTTICTELEVLGEQAENSQNHFIAIRAYSRLAQLHWYHLHSLEGNLELLSAINSRTHKSYSDIYNKVLISIKKAISIARDAQITDTNLHIILLDALTFIAVSLKEFDVKKCKDLESFHQMLAIIQESITMIHDLITNFSSELKNSPELTYEWAVIPSLLASLKDVLLLGEIKLRSIKDPTLGIIRVNTTTDISYRNADQSTDTINLASAVEDLEKLIKLLFDKETVETALKHFTDKKNSPSKISNTLLEGLQTSHRLHSE